MLNVNVNILVAGKESKISIGSDKPFYDVEILIAGNELVVKNDESNLPRTSIDIPLLPADTQKLAGLFNVKIQVYTIDADNAVLEYKEMESDVINRVTTANGSLSYNERLLKALKATMEGRASQVQSEMQVANGKAIKYLTLDELRIAIKYAESEVAKEKAVRAGKKMNRTIFVGGN